MNHGIDNNRTKTGVLIALSAVSLVFTVSGCSFAEKMWGGTKDASKTAWSATKDATGTAWNATKGAAQAVWPGKEGGTLSFEYQWQVMTRDVRVDAAQRLASGQESIQETGYAGRAACSASTSGKVRFALVESGAEGAHTRLAAGGFEIGQVGTLDTNRQCSPSVGIIPQRITIQTDSRLIVGQPVGGRALIEVSDKTFDSAGLYFKFLAHTVDVENKTVTGEFEFLSQDQANPDNLETLFVGKGSFSVPL
jgi:hypothetical protein